MVSGPSASSLSGRQITAHPLFPTGIGVWFAVLFSLSSLAVRGSLLESLVLATHIDYLIPAATPPLGTLPRVIMALLIAWAGFSIGRKVGTRIAQGEAEADRAVAEPVFGAPPQHDYGYPADAAPRRPFQVNEEVGGHYGVAPGSADAAAAMPAAWVHDGNGAYALDHAGEYQPAYAEPYAGQHAAAYQQPYPGQYPHEQYPHEQQAYQPVPEMAYQAVHEAGWNAPAQPNYAAEYQPHYPTDHQPAAPYVPQAAGFAQAGHEPLPLDDFPVDHRPAEPWNGQAGQSAPLAPDQAWPTPVQDPYAASLQPAPVEAVRMEAEAPSVGQPAAPAAHAAAPWPFGAVVLDSRAASAAAPPMAPAPVAEPQTAAERIAGGTLEKLSSVELMERLALAMQRRDNEHPSAAPQEDNRGAQAGWSAGTAAVPQARSALAALRGLK